MSIDTQAEDLIAFGDAGKSFPGRPVSLQTLHRWRLHGVRKVKLETCLIGGIRYTSHQAIQRFIAAQNAGETPVSTLTPNQRQRQSEAARRELAEMGV